MTPGASRGIRIPDFEPAPAETGLPSSAARCWRTDTGPAACRESCQISPAFFHPRADYLLRVHGMSMKDIGIYDGDLLAVHTTREARNGQIVVARVGDEVTVKRFKRDGKKVWLLAENRNSPHRSRPRTSGIGHRRLSVGVIRR